VGRISSAALVQVNGRQRVFQPATKARIVVTSSVTLSKDPRRITWRVTMPKKTSTRFSQDPEVCVKCSVILGFLASQSLMSACL
jgi:hypothetical protein